MRVLSLLTLVVSAFVRGGTATGGACPERAQDQFHLDVFTEILSNHTNLANSLTVAPLIGGMDPNAPAYEFQGSGVHLTDPYLSDALRAHSCATNEVTLVGSVFFKEGDSVGPLLELSYANSFGQSLPVFSLRVDALADEIIVAYRHQGDLHTEVFDTRLHTGKWRTYGVTLSGNQATVYHDCELMYQRIVPLPDYCANDSSLVLSVADSTQQESEMNRMSAFLQNIQLHFGPGGLQAVCPDTPEPCPSCGRFLQLTEKVYLLNQEVDRLRQRVNNLEANRNDCVSAERECAHPMENATFSHGSFLRLSNGTICFCLNGNAQCNNEVCNSTSEGGNNGGVEDPGVSTTEPTLTTEPPTRFQGCRRSGLIPALGDGQVFSLKDEGVCRVYTCMRGSFGFQRTDTTYECIEADYNSCSLNFTSTQKIVAQCCRFCQACDFVECSGDTVCMLDEGNEPKCVCEDGFELNSKGDECIDIDECTVTPDICPTLSACINKRGTFECQCQTGYMMAVSANQDRSCQDIDECASPDTNNCTASSTCVNTPGSFYCACPEGFILSPSGDCEVELVCDPPCQNGGQCVEKGMQPVCSCHQGYKGKHCEEDVNECEEDTHDCRGENAICINTQGGFFCRCSSGYMGNGRVCVDIDECSDGLDSCLAGAICANIPGSYKCLCPNDCTGHCKFSATVTLENKAYRIRGCRNCTCVDGKLSCVKLECDCANNPPSNCCPQCYRRDCIVGSVRIRPGQTWINPQNRCESIHCQVQGNRLVPVTTDLSQNCSTLNCPASLTIHPMNKCCPVCLLQPCTMENNKQTVSLRNGCETCTCLDSQWNCQQQVTCPDINCGPDQIIFSEKGCCPVCASQVFSMAEQCEA